jgi:hypothetical protein
LRADDLLLQRANALKQRRIITNDRFKDFRTQYPWLLEEDKHLVKLVVVGNNLQIPALELMVEWHRGLSKLCSELISLLGNPD